MKPVVQLPGSTFIGRRAVSADLARAISGLGVHAAYGSGASALLFNSQVRSRSFVLLQFQNGSGSLVPELLQEAPVFAKAGGAVGAGLRVVSSNPAPIIAAPTKARGSSGEPSAIFDRITTQNGFSR